MRSTALAVVGACCFGLAIAASAAPPGEEDGYELWLRYRPLEQSPGLLSEVSAGP